MKHIILVYYAGLANINNICIFHLKNIYYITYIVEMYNKMHSNIFFKFKFIYIYINIYMQFHIHKRYNYKIHIYVFKYIYIYMYMEYTYL